MQNFFYGVVEDRMDPLFIGRIRVRVFGIHSDLKVSSVTHGSPTENLLWCHVIQPTTSAAISGVGHSPTGIVEGSNVVGFFRDPMCQDGIIMGTISGIPVEYANPDKGFNDPSGQYPRYINAPDTNTRARNGQVPALDVQTGGKPSKETPASVEDQDLNTDKAPAPDDTPADDIKPLPPGDFTIEEMLRGDEGVRVSVYWDHLGFPTVGIGHLIIHEKTRNIQRINSELGKQVGRTVTDGRITNEEISKLFAGDLDEVQSGIRGSATIAPVYASLDATRRMAIENMVFQMGIGGVSNFKQSLAYMLAKEWKKAHDEMLNSTWAGQTPGRANRVAKIILNGNLASYGQTGGTRSVNDLFVEPNSPYAAQYPFNHVYESESGHIQEFDDTSGAERYFRKHPTGTFTETHPDGTVVTKIVGEDYLIVKTNRNLHVEGNLNVVIGGNTIVNIMGNSDLTVNGNVNELVRGNVTQQIDGNVTSTINGDVIETVKGAVTQDITGDVVQTIRANCNSTIAGDYTMNVDGNYTLTVGGSKVDTITGDWTRKAENVNDTASGTMKMDGGGAVAKLAGAMTLTGSTVSIN